MTFPILSYADSFCLLLFIWVLVGIMVDMGLIDRTRSFKGSVTQSAKGKLPSKVLSRIDKVKEKRQDRKAKRDFVEILGEKSHLKSTFGFVDIDTDADSGLETFTYLRSKETSPRDYLEYTRSRTTIFGVITFEWYNEIFDGTHHSLTAQFGPFKATLAPRVSSYQALSWYMNPDATSKQKEFGLQHALDLNFGTEMFTKVSGSFSPLYKHLKLHAPITGKSLADAASSRLDRKIHRNQRWGKWASDSILESMFVSIHDIELFTPEMTYSTDLAEKIRSDKQKLEDTLDVDMVFVLTDRPRVINRRNRPDYSFKPGSKMSIVSIKFRNRTLDTQTKLGILKDLFEASENGYGSITKSFRAALEAEMKTVYGMVEENEKIIGSVYA